MLLLTLFLSFCSVHINSYRKHTLFVRFPIQLLWLVKTKQSRHHNVLTYCPYLFSSWGLSIAYLTRTKKLTQTIIQLYKIPIDNLDHFGTFENHFVASRKFKFLKRSYFFKTIIIDLFFKQILHSILYIFLHIILCNYNQIFSNLSSRHLSAQS